MSEEENLDSTQELKSDVRLDLVVLYRNISSVLHERLKPTEPPRQDFNDDGNAYLYILFVLMFYAFSIVILMIKYIKREREGSKLEFYYNEYVKRENFDSRRLYDKQGRRLAYNAKQIQWHVQRTASVLRRLDVEQASESEDVLKITENPTPDVEGSTSIGELSENSSSLKENVDSKIADQNFHQDEKEDDTCRISNTLPENGTQRDVSVMCSTNTPIIQLSL